MSKVYAFMGLFSSIKFNQQLFWFAHVSVPMVPMTELWWLIVATLQKSKLEKSNA